jgi:hypothetical protein
MEQYDKTFHVEGYIQADTSWYYDQLKLWELRGRVSIRNVNGLVFRSEELFWDGIKHEFYSHQFSRLVTPERTLEGTYFRSDEQMMHYEVSNSVGSFVTDDMEGEDNSTPPTAAPSGTPSATEQSQQPAAGQPEAQPVRQKAVRKAATQKSNYQK